MGPEDGEDGLERGSSEDIGLQVRWSRYRTLTEVAAPRYCSLVRSGNGILFAAAAATFAFFILSGDVTPMAFLFFGGGDGKV